MNELDLINECEQYGLTATHPDWVHHQKEYMLFSVCCNRVRLDSTVEEVLASFNLPLPIPTPLSDTDDFEWRKSYRGLEYAIKNTFDASYQNGEDYSLGIKAFILYEDGNPVPLFV